MKHQSGTIHRLHVISKTETREIPKSKGKAYIIKLLLFIIKFIIKFLHTIPHHIRTQKVTDTSTAPTLTYIT